MRIAFLKTGVALTLIAAFSCKKESDKLFAIHSGSSVGIDFENTITTSDTFDAVHFDYIYHGAGVGVGDFNNDGLEDVFLAGNQRSSELYINRGDLRFRKTTVESGVSTTSWATGVAVADVNQDGWLDIYLSTAGLTPSPNILFINQQRQDVPLFKEQAVSLGIADFSFSIMSAFFDYDKDGDLDLYLLNNSLDVYNRNNLRPKRVNSEASNTDKLYRNDNGKYTDVSKEAGITIEGFGLGVVIFDANDDSWPDVYVSNDFMSNDLLWINQHDGTFKNEIGTYMKHQTHNGMGVDAADINNDGLPEVMVVDMLAPGHARQKMMTSGQTYDHWHMALQLGYEPQYMRNTLQFNRGKKPDGYPAFSEIAFYSGVAATDWSWAPLFADFDNDGYKDLFIANGFRRDITNLDYIFFAMENSQFGTAEARKKQMGKELAKVPEVKISNFIFRNSGNLKFEDMTDDWGIRLNNYSNGAAYADFDNDGDLDLITNNIDGEVTLLENRLNNSEKKSNHFLELKPHGPQGFNQRVRVYSDSVVQYQELTPFRGYQSTVSNRLHFGLGHTAKVDSVEIFWPDGSAMTLRHVPVDTLIEFIKPAARNLQRTADRQPSPFFTQSDILHYQHVETSPSDIKLTRTLQHELSRSGPCIARGDLNGDKLEDLYIGDEFGKQRYMYIQTGKGFTRKKFPIDSLREDGAAVIFDADNDGDNDLLISSVQANAYEPTSSTVLWLNNGNAKFSASKRFPSIATSSSSIAVNDYDGDGDLDVFLGGRHEYNRYPLPDRSYLLQNNKGAFVDVTEQVSPGLMHVGLVNASCWADINADGKWDLIVAGEWMPIKLFINDGMTFRDESKEFGLSGTEGWWQSVEAADLDSDGFPEIIAGNSGTNSYLASLQQEPVQLIAKDIDGNGSIDPLTTYYNPIEKKRFFIHNRLVLLDQVPALKKKAVTFDSYSKASAADLIGNPDDAYLATCEMNASVIFKNIKGRKFDAQILPAEAQFSTVNDIECIDINSDGKNDLVLIGNDYQYETNFGRFDASYGVVLLQGDGFNFRSLPLAKSGFITSGNARNMTVLSIKGVTTFVVTNNNDSAQTFSLIKN